MCSRVIGGRGNGCWEYRVYFRLGNPDRHFWLRNNIDQRKRTNHEKKQGNLIAGTENSKYCTVPWGRKGLNMSKKKKGGQCGGIGVNHEAKWRWGVSSARMREREVHGSMENNVGCQKRITLGFWLRFWFHWIRGELERAGYCYGNLTASTGWCAL